MKKFFSILFTVLLIYTSIFSIAIASPNDDYITSNKSSIHSTGTSKLLMTPMSIESTEAFTGAHSVTVGRDVFLHGNYIEVGVSGSGSFGTENEAPEGFHATCYEANYSLGFCTDNDGFDVGNPPTTGDFFLPGSPEEGFTVGYRNTSEIGPIETFTNVEREGDIDIPSTTRDISSGDTLAAVTEGITNDGKLNVYQVVSFGVNDKYFKNTITLKNLSETDTLFDVRYMRNVDPDQDLDLNDTYDTINAVLENPPMNERAIVRAKGAVTDEPVFYVAFDQRARAATYGFSNRDPYSNDVYQEDGSKLLCDDIRVDEAIIMTFALGNLAPGESTTLIYYTSLNADFEAGLDEIEHEVFLTNSSVYENCVDGTVVGSLSTLTECEGGIHTYTLINDAEGRFSIEDNMLKVVSGELIDYDEVPIHQITVRMTCSKEEKYYDKNFDITVLENPIQNIELDGEELILNIGESHNIVVTGIYLNGDHKILTESAIYSSSDSNVVTVDENGFIKVVGPGSAEVTITIGDITKTVSITVYYSYLPLIPVFEGYSITTRTEMIAVSEAVYDDETTVTEAVYTAHWGWENKNKFSITIPNENSTFTGCVLGGTIQPPVEFAPGRHFDHFTTEFDGNDLVWTLVDPLGNTRTATANILGKLFVPLDHIEIGTEEISIPLGDTYPISVKTVYENGSTADVSEEVVYESLNPEVVTVDETGMITAVGHGSTTIKITYCEQVMEINITVLPTIEGIILDSYAYTLSVGSTHDTIVSNIYSDESTKVVTGEVQYESLNPEVATVSETGKVTALKSGTAVIKVINGELEKEIVVTVLSDSPSRTSHKSVETPPRTTGLKDGSIIGRMPGYISLSDPIKISKLSEEIVIEFDYKKLQDHPNHTAKVYYWNNVHNKWVALASYPEGKGKVKAINDLGHKGWFTVFGIKESEISDISGHWAEQYINRMNGLGIIEGFEVEGLTRIAKAEKNITRAEFTMFLYRLLNMNPENIILSQNKELNSKSYLATKYSDVKEIPDWVITAVAAAGNNGIIVDRDGLFAANEPITRVEAAVMISRSQKLLKDFEEAKLSEFTDFNEVPEWARNEIGKDILTGYPDNTLRPNNNITRAEAITLLYRLFVTGMGW